MRREGTDTTEGNKIMSQGDREYEETKTGLQRERERMDGHFHANDQEHFAEEVRTDSQSERVG